MLAVLPYEKRLKKGLFDKVIVYWEFVTLCFLFKNFGNDFFSSMIAIIGF
jgi:hypothetical protein